MMKIIILLICFLLIMISLVSALTIESNDYPLKHCQAIAKITEMPDSVNKFICYGKINLLNTGEYLPTFKTIKLYNLNKNSFKLGVWTAFHEIQHHYQKLEYKHNFMKMYNLSLEHDKRPLEIEAEAYATKQMNNLVRMKIFLYDWKYFYYGDLNFEEHYEYVRRKEGI